MNQRLPPSGNVILRGIREEPSAEDGARVLVDRLQPRGMSKEHAALGEWAKDTTPTTELRRVFRNEDPPQSQFVGAYQAELTRRSETAIAVEYLHHETLTRHAILLLAGHDHIHCHAHVLRETVFGVEGDLT